MVVPDLEQICEIMLLSEGFDAAKVLCSAHSTVCAIEGRGQGWEVGACGDDACAPAATYHCYAMHCFMLDGPLHALTHPPATHYAPPPNLARPRRWPRR